jgi:lipopolysaccharide transport system permease protein
MKDVDSTSNPLHVVLSMYRYRSLIHQLIRREIAMRYRGSFLGVFWSLITPVLMLTIYTFVFGVVFKSRWRQDSTDQLEFAVVMFAGVVVHSLISECLTRAPGLIVGNANFVKKVVFPLEVFAWVSVGTALFHALIAMLVFAAAIVVWQGHIPWSAILVPVIFLPYIVLIVGLTWILSSLGVYLRDLGQVMGIVSSMLMFMAPVFYPLQSVPERLAPLLYLNPITFIVEQVRNVAIWGRPVDWAGWVVYSTIACLLAWAGRAWFLRMSKGFADVL